MQITVAHSPDADDYFLFWGLRTGQLSSLPFQFTFLEMDTEDLNRSARSGTHDVCAVSTAAYPEIARDYLILSSGASVGRNFGPALVASSPLTLAELAHARIGIPGRTTTAAAVLRRLVPDAETIEIPLTPYEAVFQALESGKVDAAVLIHEGQIAFHEHGLRLVTDLGKWWFTETGLPLPLGINVIRRSLGENAVRELSLLFQNSIRYSLDHKAELLPELFLTTQSSKKKLRTQAELSRYLGMYANEDSVMLDEDCRRAIALLSPETFPAPEFTD